MRISMDVISAGFVLLAFTFDFAFSQYRIPASVFGNGGTATTGNYRISGTLGQSMIGSSSSTSIKNFAGFWFSQRSITTSIDRNTIKQLPTDYRMEQNYPNPFNPSTVIEFSIPHSCNVSLKVFNQLGQEIATLISEELHSSKYKINWDASGISSGVYYYQIRAGDFIQTKKLLLIR